MSGSELFPEGSGYVLINFPASFRWLDKALSSGGEFVAFCMGFEAGKELLRGKETDVPVQLARFLRFMGFGELSTDFKPPSVTVSVTNPPVKKGSGAAARYLMGLLAGAFSKHLGVDLAVHEASYNTSRDTLNATLMPKVKGS